MSNASGSRLSRAFASGSIGSDIIMPAILPGRGDGRQPSRPAPERGLPGPEGHLDKWSTTLDHLARDRRPAPLPAELHGSNLPAEPAATLGSVASPQRRPASADSGLVGPDHQLGPVARAELGQQPADVRLDRAHADLKIDHDLVVRAALRNQFQHLTLARRDV